MSTETSVPTTLALNDAFKMESSGSSSTKDLVPLRFNNVPLFNVDLSSLANPPKLELNDQVSYQNWKMKWEQWALLNRSYKVTASPPDKLAKEAWLSLQSHGHTPEQAREKFMDLHTSVWAALSIATQPVFSDTLINQIKSEQSLSCNADKFLAHNGYHLWHRILAKFEKNFYVLYCFFIHSVLFSKY